MTTLLDILSRLRSHIIMGRYWDARELAAELLTRIEAGETFEESSAVRSLPLLRDMEPELERSVERLNRRLPMDEQDERVGWVSRYDE